MMTDEPREHATTGLRDHACAGCGYALRGLSYDQGCPECGTPVSKSVGVTGVSVTDVGIVGCRLLALWLMMHPILDILELVPSLYFMLDNFTWGREGVFLLATAGRIAAAFALGVVVWRLAPWIMRRAAGADRGVVVASGWVADATSVVFLGIGVLLLADNLPLVVGSLSGGMPGAHWSMSENVLMAAVKSIIGLVLLLHPRTIMRFVAWARVARPGRSAG